MGRSPRKMKISLLSPIHVLRDNCIDLTSLSIQLPPHISTCMSSIPPSIFPDFYNHDLHTWLTTNLQTKTPSNNMPWHTIYVFFCWRIWIRRNKRIFKNGNNPLPQLLSQTNWFINESYWSIPQH